jgi:hypothetical protein
MQIGDTFYWGDGGHLWVVISDPAQHAGEFIIVNLTHDLFRAGKECELNTGDHKWIYGKTYVAFGDAKKVLAADAVRLAKHIGSGMIHKHFPMKSNVLARIIAAAKKSRALPTGFLDYL